MGMNQDKLVAVPYDLGMEGGNGRSVDRNGIGGLTTDVENLAVWRKRVDLFMLISIGTHFERWAIDLVSKAARLTLAGAHCTLCLALFLKVRLHSPLCSYVRVWGVGTLCRDYERLQRCSCL